MLLRVDWRHIAKERESVVSGSIFKESYFEMCGAVTQNVREPMTAFVSGTVRRQIVRAERLR
jgi:hypothetical protein